MKRTVKFYPEFCEAIADGLNMISMFGGVTTKQVRVDITFPPIDPGYSLMPIPDQVVAYAVEVTPELILELMPFHQKYHNNALTEDDEFMLVANAEGMPELLLRFEKDEIRVLCMVADKIIGGARGELVPDLSGEIEVMENGSAGTLPGESNPGPVPTDVPG